MKMEIKDVLQRDPVQNPLINEGQARITDTKTEKEQQELRGELSTFVCEGQYADGIERIIRSFLDGLNKTSQRGAWVSGFFGSGKSHLLKMLCHLWQDTKFPDGATARSLVPQISSDLRSLLRELDTAGKRSGGLLAVAGSMPSGSNDQVRLTILGILFKAVGLPENYAAAQFCLWLHRQGFYEKVKASVEQAGKFFESELNDLYVSELIAQAVLSCSPNFATNEAAAHDTIQAQFPQLVSDVTTDQFLRGFTDAIGLAGRNGRLPCTILILDEVQQYIGQSEQRSTFVTEAAEAISKQLNSLLMIVGAGQNALTDVRLLNKLLDRFTIRISLSDAEVENVTRKVLLQKKPSAVGEVAKLLKTYAGEVSRELQGTRIAERGEDRDVIVDDYPLLPVRRRFWEECFRQIDAAGTSSQLRSQLRIIHDALARISERELGALIPADVLYYALAPEMITTAVLPRELSERIARVCKEKGALHERICGLVFLIGKLKRDAALDIGVRASREHIADLLVTDLTADNGKLRAEIDSALVELVEGGELMQIAGEYRLQTNAARQWDADFRARQAKLNGDEPNVQFLRDTLIYAEAGKVLASIKILQGAAREPRALLVHREQTPPQADSDGIPVWLRDQWSCTEKEMLDAARAAGAQSPIIHIFIPRRSAEDLRRLIVDAQAAKETVDAKGNPATSEEQEARQHMENRRSLAERERDKLVGEIVGSAKVFQGGGNEVLRAELVDKIREAAEASLIRLFPRFKEADSTAWGNVIKQTRQGADNPFRLVGHNDATEKHPVCQQVIASIGAGKVGSKIREELEASPFGWPRDAIDAALIALHRFEHIAATLNGAAVTLGQLDQNRISKSEFRREKWILPIQDRIEVRGVLNTLLVPKCNSGEENIRAPEFLDKLLELAHAAGGAPPMPFIPDVKRIEEIRALTGNEQLVAIKNAADEIKANVADWSKARDLANQRRPVWGTLEHMASVAPEIASAKPLLEQIAAIRDQRMLLAATDPVAPLRGLFANLLRKAATDAYDQCSKAYERAKSDLDTNPLWGQLGHTDRDRILSDVGLMPPAKPDVSTDDALLAHLEKRPLASVQTELAAIAGRAAQAVERAAKLLEPKSRPISLESATLRTAAEIDGWLARQRATLLDAIKSGPVLIG
jgi:hypothetical protein